MWKVLAFFALPALWATHGLAGQITYTYIGPNRYRVTVTYYSDSAAAGVDRCFIDMEVWSIVGNTKTLVNTYTGIPRANGPLGSGCSAPARIGVTLRPRVKRSDYVVEITLPGPGLYELRFSDFARVENVRNMTNSVATSFYIETLLNNNPFIGTNNSPILLNDPIDDACTGRLWTHNPGAYDPDGDSLVFSLIPCQQYDPATMQNPIPVANYRFPDAFGGAFAIDPRTGLITWNTPQQVGVYNIAILIEEYRNGRRIGYVIRDMAIFVFPCQNRPPVIQAPAETCITAGQRLSFRVQANDPDPTDSIYFYLNNAGLGFNGPFQAQPSPATISPSSFPLVGYNPPIVSALFSWQTVCAHIRANFYQIDWYAHDNFRNRPPLAANAVTRIYVIGPPPTGLTLTPGPRQITLTWQPPSCPPDVYEIYRSPTSQSYVDTPCCRSPLVGYELIAIVPGNQTTYTDANIEFSPRYCYRLRARYRGSLSCPSEEVCIDLPLNFPIMLQDSVHTTDAQNGAILVAWQAPLVLDTTFFPPPYSYALERTTGFTNATFQTIATGLSTDRYLDQAGLSTSAQPYRYRVRLYDGTGREVVSSNTATSIFLTVSPRDGALLLRWEQNVPWVNDTFFIYRANPPQPGAFNRIAAIPVQAAGRQVFTYLDQGLTNGQTYCYYILSRGDYGVAGIRSPLWNASNTACEAPRDTTPPCLPDPTTYQIESDCENYTIDIRWARPDSSCGGDVGSYGVYVASNPEGPYSLIQYVQEPQRHFTWRAPTTLNLCIALSARDTSNNESPLSAPICFDNCPVLMLPNTFSPNGDGINDVFRPFIYRNIRSIQCWIYDRWGMLVAQSRDIENLWDGTHKGRPAPEGTYFFMIEAELDTREKRTFRKAGSITLLR
ncbi:MAG: gliding motility-associated C-terminal domain-containing protein [Bacteroidia bacterium]|nr:gliding motility-associated C-terminal domain-containing protein [Bacteroidia bacterium]MDW8416735.1 gliding motility-associated C-terminal domain-containing protein [Bacteroidia bacterium]